MRDRGCIWQAGDIVGGSIWPDKLCRQAPHYWTVSMCGTRVENVTATLRHQLSLPRQFSPGLEFKSRKTPLAKERRPPIQSSKSSSKIFPLGHLSRSIVPTHIYQISLRKQKGNLEMSTFENKCLALVELIAPF